VVFSRRSRASPGFAIAAQQNGTGFRLDDGADGCAADPAVFAAHSGRFAEAALEAPSRIEHVIWRRDPVGAGGVHRQFAKFWDAQAASGDPKLIKDVL